MQGMRVEDGDQPALQAQGEAVRDVRIFAREGARRSTWLAIPVVYVRPIRKSPFFMRGPWFSGQPITYNVPQPLAYELDPYYEGELKPFYR